MSSSPLVNGNHPFMNHTKSALPIPHPPSKYPQGMPSANFIYSQTTPSPPGTQPPSPLGAPHLSPQMVGSYSTSSASSSASSSPTSSSSGGIFQLYQQDRCRTPELPDILSKKKTTWSQK